MKQVWQRYAALLDARKPRERALIFLMALVVLWGLVNSLLLEPLTSKRKSLSLNAQQQQEQLNLLQTQINATINAGQADPNVPTRIRLAALQEKLAQNRVALLNVQQNLVPPDKMAHLLEDVLMQNRGLKLISLNTLPADNVLQTQAEKAAQPDQTKPSGPVIYKHGVVISVSGSYGELTQYLEALEKLPWRMIWGKTEMQVETYPLVTLTITLYTLSMDETWLSV